MTLGNCVCKLTMIDIFPRVPAASVDTPIKKVVLASWLTTLELGLMEQLMFLGCIYRDPELPNSVEEPANACTTKLSE